MDASRLGSALTHGVRTSLANNVTAYGFSVMITASFGVIAAQVGSPTVGEVFLFIAGAVSGVAAVDAIASKGFRNRMAGDPSDIVALGGAFGFFSVGLGVGAATLVATILSGALAWAIGALVAPVVYVLLAGLEMGIARLLQEDREGTDEEPREEEEESEREEEGGEEG